MSKPIFLFYRFQLIINKSHKSFIHNHFVCRLLFFSIVDYDRCVSKRRCSKAEREGEGEGGKRKGVFFLSRVFFLPYCQSLFYYKHWHCRCCCCCCSNNGKKKKDGVNDDDEEEKEKEENEKKKKKKKKHTVRDLFDYFVTSLSMLYALDSLTATKSARTISYFSLTELVANIRRNH